MDRSPVSGERERGVTSPIGLIMVFGVIVTGTVAVVAVGSMAIEDTQRSLDAERAEKVMTQLDSQTSMVALGNARSQRLPLVRTDGARYRVDGDDGWMNVTVRNTTADTTDTIMNATLGSITYQGPNRAVTYQGGGVWKAGERGSTMVSPPEFYYRQATLTLPLVTVSGDPALDDRAVIQKDGPSTQYFPNRTGANEWANPLENGMVNVTVHSRYYEAWGTFFEERTDGDAAVDHENQTATLTLVVPAGPRTVRDAIAATSSGGEIVLSGSGGNATRTDSYNSSLGTGTYADTQTDEGTVRTAGDVTVKGNSVVEGSVESGGFVAVKGSGEVTKDVRHAEGTKITGTVGGTVKQITGVDGAGPIDTVVQHRYKNVSKDNDNGNTSAISGDSLASGSQTLGPGSYHLTELVRDGDTLTLDTGSSGEEIVIAVRDHVTLKNDGRIEVQGNGQVRFYVDGQSKDGDGKHFRIDNSGGVVDIADAQNASQLWIYGRHDFQAEVDGDSGKTQRFEGVIYAPAGGAGESDFQIDHAELFGGVVTGSVHMGNSGAIHYDRSLLGEQAVPPNEMIVRLTYLHVSKNPVAVSG